MKYLYLDQNIWIYLAQVYYGKNHNKVLNKIIERIDELIEEKLLIVPISLANVIEVQKISDSVRRERLANFMIKISRGYCFIPYPYVIDLEIENLIRDNLFLPKYNIPQKATGIGVFFLIHNGNPPIVIKSPPISEEEQALLWSIANERFAKPEAVLEFVLKIEGRPIDGFLSTVDNMEKISKINWQYKDKNYRNRIRIAKYLMGMVAPRIAYWCSQYGIHPFLIIPYHPTFEELIVFFKKLPLLYSNFCLHNGIEKIPNRPYEVNDIPDLANFCFTIPYYDYVIGEKFLISIARKEKLNEIYKTKLYTKKDINKLKDELKKIQ